MLGLGSTSGLICPVILRRCGWEPLVGQLQVVPTKGRRVAPIADWEPPDHGYDEARSRIDAAIRSHFHLTPKTQQWFGPLLGLREEQPGPIWVEREGQFDLDPSGNDQDTLAAADRVTAQLHALNRAKAAGFAAKIARLANSLGQEWDGFIPAAKDLAEVLERSTYELPDHVAPVWEASVRLASFLEMDKRLLASLPKDQEPLPDDILRAFDDLIGSVAPWVRRFPTARALDDDRGAYLTNPALFAPVARVIQLAEDSRLITQATAEKHPGQRSDRQPRRDSGSEGRNLCHQRRTRPGDA